MTTTKPSLPNRVEAITPTWMSEVLSFSHPSVEISGVNVLDRHTGTTGRARIALEYASGSAGPETVFVKLPPFSKEQRELVASTDMGRKEARFYESLAAEVPVRVPRPYFAAHGDEPTQYIMVLEDLEASGCVFTRKIDGYVRGYGQKVVESLARLHAHFWEDPRFDGEMSWLPPFMRGTLGAKLVGVAREQYGAEMPPVFAELCDVYIEHYDAIVELWDEGPKTMIHGDIHAGNQFVDGDGIGIYDWAVISRSPGIRDVGIFLCNSCPPNLLRENGEAWLHRYHQTLVDAGVQAPDFDTLWLRFRRAVLYGWITATTTAAVGDRWQPLEVSLPSMRRATEICADLGTVEAIRDAL